MVAGLDGLHFYNLSWIWGDPVLSDEGLEPFDVEQLEKGDVIGIGLHTGNALVGYELGLRFELSLQVAIMATLVAIIIAIPLGAISAIKQDTWIDYVVRSFSILGIAIPSFWLGIMIILGLLIFTQHWLGEPWMPPIEYVSPLEDLGGNLAQLIWPAVQ